MLTVLQVASYLLSRYFEQKGTEMDEMKLHKLLYFSQRESFIQNGAPLFAEQFEAWQYGPVMVCVREAFGRNELVNLPSEMELAPHKKTFDSVFEIYANRSSWTLSMLSHAESSWKKAREGYSDKDTNCHNLINTEDIRNDAMVIKQRRNIMSSVSTTM